MRTDFKAYIGRKPNIQGHIAIINGTQNKKAFDCENRIHNDEKTNTQTKLQDLNSKVLHYFL